MKKVKFILGVIAAISTIFAMTSCDLELRDSENRLSMNPDKIVYPMIFNGVQEGAEVKLPGLDPEEGVSIEFKVKDLNKDWDCILFKTAQTWIMSPNIGYYPNGIWEENCYPGDKTDVNVGWDCLLNKEATVRVEISSDIGVAFYVDDVLSIRYKLDATFTTSTVLDYVYSFFDDCENGVIIGTYTGEGAGEISDVVVSKGVEPIELE